MRSRWWKLGALASLSWIVSGCSLVIDTDPYQRRGDGGAADAAATDAAGRDAATPDAGFDAGPDAPSTPVIEITPADPLTGDDLVATVVTESVDPLGAGAITYEFSWNDGAVTGATVTADMTSKDETWTVAVTPVTADSRRGLAGGASVTIGDTPPEVGTVGLSDYRPSENDTLVAYVGPITDVDGDGVAPRFAWYRNDTVIAGETSNSLDLGSVGPAADDRIRVEATATGSGLDGNTVRSGDARVLPDNTRWRQLLPNRVFSLPAWAAYDAAHRRVVFASVVNSDLDEIELWEFALDPSVGGRFTKLHPTGPVPPMTSVHAIYDPTGERILLLNGVPDIDSGTWTSDVYQLDVSTRGAEAFSLVTPSGTPPSPRASTTVAFDPRSQIAYIYSGSPMGGSPLNEMWTLDLSIPGAGAWTELTGPRPPMVLFGASMFVDQARDRVLLLAGVEFGGAAEPSTGIYSLDLTNLAAGFVLQSATLSEGRAFINSPTSVTGDVAMLGYGVTMAGAASDFILLDLATLGTTTFDPGGVGPAEGSSRGFIAADELEGGLIVLPGGAPFGGGFELDLYSLQPSGLDPIHETGEDLPGALRGTLTQRGTMFGGIDQDGVFHEEVWQRSGDRFARRTIAADSVTGNSPGPRANQVIDPTSPFSSNLAFFSGEDASGLADRTVWELRSTEWVERYDGGALAPRSGAMLFGAGCGNTDLVVFSGNASGLFSNQTVNLDCTGPRSCTWGGGGSTPQAPRELGTVTRLQNETAAILFGGRDASTEYQDVWSFDPCGGGWSSVTLTGLAPSPRFGHSAVLFHRSSATADEVIVFGGQTGTTRLNDVHVFTVTSATTGLWGELTVASGPLAEQIPARSEHTAFFDDTNNRILIYGGRSFVGWSDLWELRLR